MIIKSFPVNPLSENCYVVSDETREAVIIDCGAYYDDEKAMIAKYIRDNDLKPVAHLLTHAHFDHFWGADYIAELYGLPPRCPQPDRPLYDDVDGQVRSILHYSIRCANPPAGEDITPESVIRFGNHRLTVIPCPGHTPGGVCYYCEEEKVLFSGDSLFQNSIGRTDFPGGDLWTLIDALKALIKTLPPDTVVYPGHGLKTTIGTEHHHNPYLFG
ncbi:MAG: MBL fold metallo-hydrolase [Prevotella sp.]|nr:MBL fold metallo-hydrolase [Prevotella sp.]